MNVLQIVREAKADGLHLYVLPNGNLRIAGQRQVYQKWNDTIKTYKSRIVSVIAHEVQEFDSLYRFIAKYAGWNDMDY